MSLRSHRRAHRAAYENDDLDGLPVRQWRDQWVKVVPTTQHEESSQEDRWTREPDMPKDFPLLPAHSQELLRLARSGRLYKRPAPLDNEEGGNEVGNSSAKDEAEVDEREASAYMARVWKPAPRNGEDAPVSYLAKRRKGTVTIASKTIVETPTGPTVTKATVRRIDAAGNPYTQEVTLQPGQNVDGEIISMRQVVLVPAAKVEAPPPELAPVNRRRAPPPKRKPRGPGRGRKKKVVIEGEAAAPVTIPMESALSDGAKKEESANPEGGDQSMIASDDENDDEDDGDDNEEGDDNEGDDSSQKANQDTEMFEVQTPGSRNTPDANTSSGSPDIKEESMPPVTNSHLSVDPTPFEASPLRNVMTIAPSPSQSKPASPKAETAADTPEETTEIKVESEALKVQDEDVEMGDAESLEAPKEPSEEKPAVTEPESEAKAKEVKNSEGAAPPAEALAPVSEAPTAQDEDIDMTEASSEVKEETKLEAAEPQDQQTEKEKTPEVVPSGEEPKTTPAEKGEGTPAVMPDLKVMNKELKEETEEKPTEATEKPMEENKAENSEDSKPEATTEDAKAEEAEKPAKEESTEVRKEEEGTEKE